MVKIIVQGVLPEKEVFRMTCPHCKHNMSLKDGKLNMMATVENNPPIFSSA